MSYQSLAKVLGTSPAEAEKRWKNTKLDGDEQYAIGFRHELPFDDSVGRNGNAEYERGIKKLKDQPEPKPKKKSSKKK